MTSIRLGWDLISDARKFVGSHRQKDAWTDGSSRLDSILFNRLDQIEIWISHIRSDRIRINHMVSGWIRWD